MYQKTVCISHTVVCAYSRDVGKLKTNVNERALSSVLPYSNSRSRKLTNPTVSISPSVTVPFNDALMV